MLRLVGVLVLLSFGVGLAHADKGKAKAHYKRGMAAFVLNQFDEAIVAFEAGFREEPEPAFLFNIAQAHGKAGRAARAVEFYRKYLDMSGERVADRAQVEQRIAELEKQLARPVDVPKPVEPPKPVDAANPVDQATATPTVLTYPAKAARPGRPRWVWAVVGVSAVIVVGAVVGGVVAATIPSNAPSRAGTEPAIEVRF